MIEQHFISPVVTKINSTHIEFLRQFRQFLCGNPDTSSVIIAGGAVRDSYFKKPINDIDIYYQHLPDVLVDGPEMENLNTLKSFAKTLPSSDTFGASVAFDSATPRENWNITGSYGSPFIRSIVDVVHMGQRYQLIAVNMPAVEFVEKHFNVDLCRCWCDGKRMRYPSAFMRDAKNKTITIAGDIGRQQYHYTYQHHLPKIQEKYPDFTVVDTLKGKKWDK